jgi:hypothetical protein
MTTTKPFHLLTPQEKTILRIAQNRAISEKASAMPPAKSSPAKSSPAKSSTDYVRATPEEHVGRVIRKVKA